MSMRLFRSMLWAGWMLSLAIGLTGCGGGDDGGIDEGIDFDESAAQVVSPSELEAAAGPDPVGEEETATEETPDADAPVAIAPPLDSPAPEPETP